MSAGHEDRNADGPFDMTARDQVKLSPAERQSLAHLEARMRLEDPDFVTRMRGRSIRWMRNVAAEMHFPVMPAWLGPVLFVVGLIATLGAIAISPWLSILTLAVAVVGAYRIGLSLRAKAEQNARSAGNRRTDPNE